MLLVALAALLMFGEQMRKVRRYRLLKASEFATERIYLLVMKAKMEKSAANIRDGMSTQPEVVRQMNGVVLGDLERDLSLGRIREEYANRLARWYGQRASRPWEPLGEEPPKPKELRP